jgi:hypothetical protein
MNIAIKRASALSLSLAAALVAALTLTSAPALPAGVPSTTDISKVLSAQDIARWCSPGGNEAFCNIWFNAFVMGLNVERAARDHDTPICVPDSVSEEDVRNVALQYFAKFPLFMTQPAGVTVGVAMSFAYPCEQRYPGGSLTK